ncbi:hypothetical protein C8R46DRAFT_1063347, partial [Mycena filopes]
MSHLSTTSASRSVPKTESGFVTGVPPPQLRSNFSDNNSSLSALGRRPPSRRSQRAVPSTLKGTAILAAFLPLPPLVSVIYLACGHVVLRASHPALYAPVPLISSVRAAAVGGAILALPLAVLLYLLYFPTKPAPEDFFDDDEGALGRGPVGLWDVCALRCINADDRRNIRRARDGVPPRKPDAERRRGRRSGYRWRRDLVQRTRLSCRPCIHLLEATQKCRPDTM